MTSAAVAASDVQVATSDLVIDLSRFAATIDTARLDAAVIKAVKTKSRRAGAALCRCGDRS
jgi:hypothetical protein